MDTPTLFFVEIWGRRNDERIPGGIRSSWKAEYYTFKEGSEDGSVRDDRHVDEIVKSLLVKSNVFKNEKPQWASEFTPWFTVVVAVSGTRRKISHYGIDYHTHPGAPLEIIDQGMWIYKLIKHNIKEAKKKGQAK